MAEFYLPIKIGQRRMHICHLNNPNEWFGFEFIIPIAGNDIELFSFSHNAKLISTKGTKSNIEPKNLKFEIEHSEVANDSIEIKITFEAPDGKNNIGLKSSEFGISIDRDSHSNFVAKATNLISVKKLNITICYKEKDKDPFEYSFSIHTPKENDETKIYKVAFDFGSEASQVGYRNHSGSEQPHFIRLVDSLKEFHIQHNSFTNFWQGKLNDVDTETSRLFKSVFFINKNPENGYEYADKPNKNGEHTILQTITPRVPSSSHAYLYDPLFLLPNLKLVELLADNNFLSDDIIFRLKTNNPRGYEGKVSILRSELVEDYIRIILNNFLYSVLHSLKSETKSEKYLHITLLMPNVYSQKKVYSIIRNFYTDFNEIIKEDEYKNFKGVEVQAMSESDASFIGARSNVSQGSTNRISNKSHENYLVIDAGKGTTDFSVIKQQNSFVKYDSRFRTGLPGSGQMLSYAFIEAIAEHLSEINLIEMIKNETAYSVILDFMELVEQLKKNYTKYEEFQPTATTDSENGAGQESRKSYEKYSRLSQVNQYLISEFIDKQKRIPGSDTKVNQKVSELVDKIEENIHYSGVKTFHQVILAGRAFRFEPLLRAVKSKFEGLVTADNKFIFQNSHSKFICIEGAFQGEYIHINLNSELIGSPVILDENYKPYTHKNWYDRFFSSKEEKFIDEIFFYNGMKLKYDLKNKIIRIGARDYSPTVASIEAAKESSFLFYTGDGFMLQWANGANTLSEKGVSQSFTKMVEETLFPFAYIRFGNNNGTDSGTPKTPPNTPPKTPPKSPPEKPQTPKKPDSDDILS